MPSLFVVPLSIELMNVFMEKKRLTAANGRPVADN